MAALHRGSRVGTAAAVALVVAMAAVVKAAPAAAAPMSVHQGTSPLQLLRAAADAHTAARAGAASNGRGGVGTAGVTTVLFLPLDERFTTRDAFLHLAYTTDFRVRRAVSCRVLINTTCNRVVSCRMNSVSCRVVFFLERVVPACRVGFGSTLNVSVHSSLDHLEFDGIVAAMDCRTPV